jgi:hypothetical protein
MRARAALKLSPFSTLTRVGLGHLAALLPDGAPLRLLGCPDLWREVSLVRLRRYLVEQLAELLARHPRIRDPAPIHLNPTLTPTGPGLYRLLQPAGWRPGPRGELRFRPLAPAELPLSPELVAWLEQRLTTVMCFADLAAALGEDLGDAARATASLAKLVDLGALLLELPWGGSVGHLEESLAETLRELADEPSLAAVAVPLERLVRTERSWAETGDPARAACRIQESLALAFAAALPPSGLSPRGDGRSVRPLAGRNRGRARRAPRVEALHQAGWGLGDDDLVAASRRLARRLVMRARSDRGSHEMSASAKSATLLFAKQDDRFRA